MCSVIGVLLFTFVAQAHVLVNRTAGLNGFSYELVDRLSDKLSDQALKAWSLRRLPSFCFPRSDVLFRASPFSQYNRHHCHYRSPKIKTAGMERDDFEQHRVGKGRELFFQRPPDSETGSDTPGMGARKRATYALETFQKLFTQQESENTYPRLYWVVKEQEEQCTGLNRLAVDERLQAASSAAEFWINLTESEESLQFWTAWKANWTESEEEQVEAKWVAWGAAAKKTAALWEAAAEVATAQAQAAQGQAEEAAEAAEEAEAAAAEAEAAATAAEAKARAVLTGKKQALDGEESELEELWDSEVEQYIRDWWNETSESEAAAAAAPAEGAAPAERRVKSALSWIAKKVGWANETITTSKKAEAKKEASKAATERAKAEWTATAAAWAAATAARVAASSAAAPPKAEESLGAVGGLLDIWKQLERNATAAVRAEKQATMANEAKGNETVAVGMSAATLTKANKLPKDTANQRVNAKKLTLFVSTFPSVFSIAAAVLIGIFVGSLVTLTLFRFCHSTSTCLIDG